MSYPVYDASANAIDSFVPGASAVNSIWGLIRIAPYITSLAGFFQKSPKEMQALLKSLQDLSTAQETNNFEKFQVASAQIIEAIVTIESAPNKKAILKKYGYFQSWEGYLLPLTTLKDELTKFQAGILDSSNRGPLNNALTEALNFTFREVSGQDGLLVKGLDKIRVIVKKWVSEQVRGAFGLQQEIVSEVPKKSPLMGLLDHLKYFKFQGKLNNEVYIRGVLSSDISNLDKKGTFFEGVNDYIKTSINEESPYIDQVHVLIRAFILLRLDQLNEPIFFQEVYNAAVRNKSINNEVLILTTEDQKKWGEWKLAHLDDNSQDTLIILEAVAATIEINYFNVLIKNLELTRFEDIYPNAGTLLQELQEHPFMRLHPEFEEKMGALIKVYIDSAFKKGIDANQAHRANHTKNFLNALAKLRNIIRPTVVKEDSQISRTAVNAIGALRNFGISAQILDPVASAIQLGAERVDSFLEAQSRKKDEVFPMPLMNLCGKIREYREQYSDPRFQTYVQDYLDEYLVRVELAYPNFKGLTECVRSERAKNKELLVVNIDRNVTRFILTKVTQNDLFYRAIYHAAVKLGMVRSGERMDPKLQIDWGKKFMGEINTNQRHDIFWEAVGFILEIEKLEVLIESLKFDDADTEADVSRKVDILLAYLENNPHIQGSEELLQSVIQMVIPLVQTLMSFKNGLNREQKAEIETQFLVAMDALGENPTASDAGKALKILKALFDTGPLTPMVGVIGESDSPISEVTRLSAEFESGKTHRSGTLTPQTDQNKINQEERKLAHNLSMFGAFKVMSNYCGLTPQASEDRFEKILVRVEAIPYNGSLDQLENKRNREKIFKEELDKMLAESPRFGIHLLNWIVFKIVKHFTSEFSKSLVQNAQIVMLNPSNSPLKGHHGVIKGINNGFLALLFSERAWNRDTEGTLGVEEKEAKLIKILEGLNGNASQKSLINQVIDKALNEFPIGTFSNNRILNGIGTFFVKRIAKVFVKRMDLANTVLATMSDAIYSEKHINYNLDALLLKQLQELEKILGEDAEELVIHEGDNGKRLVKQLVNNLFELLRARGIMTPQQLDEKRNSLLGQLDETIGGVTDEIVKQTLEELFIFGLETFKEEQRMKQTLLDVLKLANCALRPNTESLLRELYNEDPTMDTSTEAVLIARFQREYSFAEKGKVTRKECEAALQKKYGNTEKQLHEVLGRIMDKTIQHVIEDQVNTHLKTAREAVLEHIQWLQMQFSPHYAFLKEKKTYIEEMKNLCAIARSNNRQASPEAKERAKKDLEVRHKKLFIQLQKQLKLLKTKEGEGASKTNLQIKRLYHVTNELVQVLEGVNSALIAGHYGTAYNRIGSLEEKMKAIEPTLQGIQFTLATENQTVMKRGFDLAAEGGRKAAELVTPLVRIYLKGRLTHLANEGVAMYKSRAVFKAMTDQAVFRSYMEYQPSSDQTSPEDTVAENLQETFVMMTGSKTLVV